jgi:hypothetical protein
MTYLHRLNTHHKNADIEELVINIQETHPKARDLCELMQPAAECLMQSELLPRNMDFQSMANQVQQLLE